MKRIFLIGFMGSGKTTLGKMLAEKLDYTFIDLDHYIEKRNVKKIAAIFAESGEDAFREIEHKMLIEVCSFENVVISTGGGTPCYFDNIEIMNNSGLCIYLKISNEVLLKRLQKAKEFRPLIKDKSDTDLACFIYETLSKREKYYTQASIITPNDEENPDEICNKLLSLIHTPANT